jgi:hypothetical protein
MKTATIADTKSHLSALLAEIAAGGRSSSLAGESLSPVWLPSRKRPLSSGLTCMNGLLQRLQPVG